MNYYEELGITPGACADDIRKAHRLVCKVLHPDLQSNSEMQTIALIQMSRINAIVDTLLDPQRRHEYDQSLRAQPRLKPLSRLPVGWWPPPVHLRLPGVSALSLLGTVAAAVLLTMAAVWFLAGDMLRLETTAGRPQLSSTSGLAPRAASPVNTGVANPSVREAASQPAAQISRASAPVAQSDPTDARGETNAIAPLEVAPEAPPASAASRSEPTPPQPLVSSAPVPASTPPAEGSSAEAPAFAGLWIYTPALDRPNPRRVKVYEPEYIQLRIDVDKNTLRGEYAARYHVPDRPISSEVEFVFQGKNDDTSFPWEASDGTSGTVDLKMLGAHLIEVDWRVAVYGKRIGLGTGTAVLARQRNP
jgi:curved DNA-binding protein CbpA